MDGGFFIELEPSDKDSQLKQLINSGETQQIEFKQRLNKPYKIAKTLAAFANTDGGTLLIGISDRRQVMGVDVDREKYILNEAIGGFTSPHPKVEVKEIFTTKSDSPFDECSVLIVSIPEGMDRPYRARNKDDEWKVYLRSKDESLPAGKKAEQLIEQSNPKPKSVSKNIQRLLKYLDRHHKITLKEFSNLVNISERRARRELENALLDGHIRVLEHEKTEYYIR